MGFANDLLAENGPQWCTAQGIDTWDYPELGWRATIVQHGETSLISQKLVALAYQQRQSLVEAFTAPIAGGETQTPASPTSVRRNSRPWPTINPSAVRRGVSSTTLWASPIPPPARWSRSTS